jgi:outer membrane protein TolC
MKGSFNRMLSREASETVFVPDSLPVENYTDKALSLNDSAISTNPMVKMYQAEQSSNQSKVAKAKKTGYPMLGIGLDYMVLAPRSDVMGSDNGKDMVMPMVTLTLPIYRKKYSAMQREAEYLTNASKMKEDDTRNMLFTDYQNAVADLNDANRRIDQYHWQAEIIGKSLHVLMASYKSNSVGMDEVLQMQQKQLEMQYKLVEAEVNKRNAIANIKYILFE